jgi:hypothetical protein
MSTTQSDHNHAPRLPIGMVAVALILLSVARSAAAGPAVDTILPLQVSTVPSNGDLNPYGLALVPGKFPGNTLRKGQLLVSNFNNANNSQGMGSTIIVVDPTSGKTGLFFQGTPPIGFTNALSVAEAGFVFAGSVFTTDGATGQPGPLLVFDKDGNQVGQLTASDKINGPWGLAINDQEERAQLFVANVFDGTITRLEVSLKHGHFSVMDTLTIASGYAFGPDPTAIVVGPAGLAYDSKKDILYVASPSFVSGQTREGITRTGRRCPLPPSHTLILESGRLRHGDGATRGATAAGGASVDYPPGTNLLHRPRPGRAALPNG